MNSVLKKQLPDGNYRGYWTASEVQLNHDGEQWFIKTSILVKGVNVPVDINVKNGDIIIEVIKNDRKVKKA